jgi:hypothetical protein
MSREIKSNFLQPLFETLFSQTFLLAVERRLDPFNWFLFQAISTQPKDGLIFRREQGDQMSLRGKK